MLEKGHALDPRKDRLMKNHGGIPGSLVSTTASLTTACFSKMMPNHFFNLDSISFLYKMPQRVRADLRQFVSFVFSSADQYLEPA